MREDSNTSFIGDALMLSSPAMLLLRRLDPEPEFVKRYIKELCKRVSEKGWIEQTAEKDWIKEFERKKYRLKILIIHARKGEHVTGADMVFELEDKKIVFIQSKKVSTNGRIHFDRFQLFKMMELEKKIQYHDFTDICIYCIAYRLKEEIPLNIPFSKCKGTFYQLTMVEDTEQIQKRFFHSSEICAVLGSRKSLNQNEFLNKGLNSNDFEKMFWGCQIGCPDINESEKRRLLHFYSLCTGRVVLLLNVNLVKND